MKYKRMMQKEFREESLLIAQHLQTLAHERGILPGQFATAWVLANQSVNVIRVDRYNDKSAPF